MYKNAFGIITLQWLICHKSKLKKGTKPIGQLLKQLTWWRVNTQNGSENRISVRFPLKLIMQDLNNNYVNLNYMVRW